MPTFQIQPQKIDVGAVYHYVKSNRDGSHPEQVALRVAADDRIEAFKYHPRESPAALVTAQMDWNLFCAIRLESRQLFSTGEHRLAATFVYLPASQALEVSVPLLARGPERIAIPFLPFHVYNFDLASLNFAFRHLADPRQPFQIGIADPVFTPGGPAFHYRGQVDVRYLGDEDRQGAACRKFRIDGAGLEHRGGWIWVNRSGEYFEDLEVDLPDNPHWKDFKLCLQRVERMSLAVWERFMRAQL